MGIRYKIIWFKSAYFLLLFAIFLCFFVVSAYAQDPANQNEWEQQNGGSVAAPTGLGNAFNSDSGSPLNAVAVQGGGFNTSATFETIISKVITMVLELMGVIFLILAIYGGFKWMTAAGNEESVEKAKKTITNAILGLVIVLAAYAIVKFIVEIFGVIAFKST
jgi:cbb3-type cytochrome oxidase subunit 3